MKVVLGLSGGVDSCVAAKLLQENGYEVFGLYLDIGTVSARSRPREHTCGERPQIRVSCVIPRSNLPR